MKSISVEDIKAGFDEVITGVQDDPVRVQADGRDVAIILSPDLYAFLLKEPPADVRSRVAALYKRSVVERGRLYRALAKYESEHPRVRIGLGDKRIQPPIIPFEANIAGDSCVSRQYPRPECLGRPIGQRHADVPVAGMLDGYGGEGHLPYSLPSIGLEHEELGHEPTRLAAG